MTMRSDRTPKMAAEPTSADPIREALERLVSYAVWQIEEGGTHHPTLPSAVACAREALSLLTTKASDDELVERVVAEAIHYARYNPRFEQKKIPFAEVDDDGREYCFRLARAALSSMPTIADEGERARLIDLADLETWRKVERAIGDEAERLCREGCRDERCPCGARRDSGWRRDAIASLRSSTLQSSASASVGSTSES
jgi:hypothetical protein